MVRSWGADRDHPRPGADPPTCDRGAGVRVTVPREESARTAVVVGSGPNGLVAAITLARAGWDVAVYEESARPGGGMRSEELTVPGAIHDVCSAIHPIAVGSPAFREIAASGALTEHGLEWLHSDV